MVVIGCGYSSPIPAYAELTKSPYAIYTCPSLTLHEIFDFTSKMSGSKKGEEKEYERELGGTANRIWNSLVAGPIKHIEHVSSVGPKGQNGGEVVIEPGEFAVAAEDLEGCGLRRCRWDLFVHPSDATCGGPHRAAGPREGDGGGVCRSAV